MLKGKEIQGCVEPFKEEQKCTLVWGGNTLQANERGLSDILRKEGQCGWVLGSSQEAGIQGVENGLKWRDEEKEAGSRISKIIYHGAPQIVVHHADSSVYIRLNSDTKPLSPTHRHTESLSQNRAQSPIFWQAPLTYLMHAKFQRALLWDCHIKPQCIHFSGLARLHPGVPYDKFT